MRGNNIERFCVVLNSDNETGNWVDVAKGFRKHQGIKRIVTQEVSNMQQVKRLNGAIINEGIYVGHTANYLIPKTDLYKIEYYVALLNSSWLDFVFQTFNSTNHIPAREIKRLPFKEIDD